MDGRQPLGHQRVCADETTALSAVPQPPHGDIPPSSDARLTTLPRPCLSIDSFRRSGHTRLQSQHSGV